MRRERLGKEAEAEAAARGKLDEAVGVAIGPGRGGEQGVVEWFWSSWRRPRPATAAAGEGRHVGRTLQGLWSSVLGRAYFLSSSGRTCENSSAVFVKLLIKIYKERDQIISKHLLYVRTYST